MVPLSPRQRCWHETGVTIFNAATSFPSLATRAIYPPLDKKDPPASGRLRGQQENLWLTETLQLLVFHIDILQFFTEILHSFSILNLSPLFSRLYVEGVFMGSVINVTSFFSFSIIFCLTHFLQTDQSFTPPPFSPSITFCCTSIPPNTHPNLVLSFPSSYLRANLGPDLRSSPAQSVFPYSPTFFSSKAASRISFLIWLLYSSVWQNSGAERRSKVAVGFSRFFEIMRRRRREGRSRPLIIAMLPDCGLTCQGLQATQTKARPFSWTPSPQSFGEMKGQDCLSGCFALGNNVCTAVTHRTS